MSTGVTRTDPNPTLVDQIWDSIVTPGVGPGIIAFVNASLLVLIAVVLYCAYNGYETEHMMVLLVLSVVMLAVFNWYVHICSIECIFELLMILRKCRFMSMVGDSKPEDAESESTDTNNRVQSKKADNKND